MDGYVAKPIRAKELFTTMENVLPDPADRNSSPDPAEPRPDPRNQKVDWSEALEMTGGDRDLLIEVIEAFQTETPQLLQNMKQAADSQNAELLHRSAHTLKNAMYSIVPKSTGDLRYVR
jgi:hypothetical protein